MGFRNGAYAKVWEVKTGKGNYADVRISVSEKDKRTDEYVTAFSGFVRFIGDAYKTLPEEGDRIKLDNVDVTNTYDKEKKTTFWNAKCFGWSPSEGEKKQSGFMDIPDDAMESLPFN